jgi:hypothetical protein
MKETFGENLEVKDEERIGKDIASSLEVIGKAEIFNPKYLNNLKFAVGSSEVPKDTVAVYAGGKCDTKSAKEFPKLDFIYGKRTDFVWLDDKKEYEKAGYFDCQRLFIGDDVKIPYEEFVVHETAHNIFDLNYDERNEKAMLDKIIQLAEKHVPGIKLYFSGSGQNIRQKIAEIFTLTVQEEFSEKKGNPSIIPNSVESMNDFMKNPAGKIAEFNQKNGTDVTIDEIIHENHIPAFVIASILKRGFPDFSQRIKFFGFKKAEKYLNVK